MLTFALCPVFKFFSFTFLICLIDIAMFVILVSISLTRDSSYFKDTSYLLGIKAPTLIEFGGNYQPNVWGG